MKQDQGFSLLELLVSLGILGLLLGAVMAFTESSTRLERKQRALAVLAEDLSLTATVLAREVYMAGYRVSSGTALAINGAGTTLTLRFFCEPGMEIYCSTSSMGKVRTVQYILQGSTLYWGTCDGTSCTPTSTHPVLDGVLHFRLAYRSRGSWGSSSLQVDTGTNGPSPKVEALALYLLVQSPLDTGAGSFTPGSTVAWNGIPDGESLKRELNLPSSAGEEGKPVAEKLVVVMTPNLNP